CGVVVGWWLWFVGCWLLVGGCWLLVARHNSSFFPIARLPIAQDPLPKTYCLIPADCRRADCPKTTPHCLRPTA
ncbi:MAG: hypothetical protein SAJ12_17815, partial [Jaaginema sp. PMC 1079.18]|nr:hypothetical protein [Jaaginema sp. PMC 1079.18]